MQGAADEPSASAVEQFGRERQEARSPVVEKRMYRSRVGLDAQKPGIARDITKVRDATFMMAYSPSDRWAIQHMPSKSRGPFTGVGRYEHVPDREYP